MPHSGYALACLLKQEYEAHNQMEQTLRDIIEFLPVKSITSLYMLSKSYSNTFSSQNIWPSLLRRDFPYCQGFSCPLTCTDPHLHYQAHYNMQLAHGLGLHLSASPSQLALGDRLSVTVTIFNTTESPIDLEVGHSAVDVYYESGGLFVAKWREGCMEECRKSCISSTSLMHGGSFIDATIKASSFIQFKTSAKLRDLSIKKPRKWETWNSTDMVLCFPKYHLPVSRSSGGSLWLNTLGLRRLLKSNVIKIDLI